MIKASNHSVIFVSAFAAVCVGLTGCGSSDNDATATVASGTTFSDASALLMPFQRGLGEGYGGVAWLDYDGDLDLDIMLTNEKDYSNALMRNNGDGSFTDVTIAANATVMTGSSGIVAGDIDNDGCADIFMSGAGFFAGPAQSPTVLLHSKCDGSGQFEDISATANVPGAETALSAAFGDINNDGFIDLYVAAEGHLPFGSQVPAEQHEDRLYLNNGDLTFTDITVAAGVQGGLGSCVASFSHFDDDEYIDLFVGVCNAVDLAPTPWHVYKNNGPDQDGNISFTDVAAQTRLDKGGYWMASAFGDIDNDGDFDIFTTNLGFAQKHHLWRNNGDGTYVNIAPSNGEGEGGTTKDFWAWGATFADFDNDTFQDIYYAGELAGVRGTFGKGDKGFMFFNNGNSRFTVADNAAIGIGPDGLKGRGVTGLAKADYDGDGFVDLIAVTSPTETFQVATPVLLRNNGNGNTSLSIRLQGTPSYNMGKGSNSMGIGARIEIISLKGAFQAREIWAGSSFASSESPWPVFGLGTETSADATVYWPSGLAESWDNLAAGELHTLVEGSGTPL